MPDLECDAYHRHRSRTGVSPTRGEEWSSTQAGKPDAAHEQIYIDAPSFVVGIVASILVAAFTLALLSAIDGVIA